jgi:2'-5' RNA ligase
MRDPASIWRRLEDEQEASLRALIERLANTYGTVPFQPHLTVCSLPLESLWDAAAEYVRQSMALPLLVRKTAISFSTTAPMMAVVIDVDDTPQLRSFREDLRQIVHAPEPSRPHISLLYSVDEIGQRPRRSFDESHLKSIVDECSHRVEASEFVLARPVIVSPDRDWQNIRSWRVVRTLHP